MLDHGIFPKGLSQSSKACPDHRAPSEQMRTYAHLSNLTISPSIFFFLTLGPSIVSKCAHTTQIHEISLSLALRDERVACRS